MHYLRTLTMLLLLGPAIYAQLPVTTLPKPPDSAKPEEQDSIGRDTPRGCVLGFLKAGERGDYAQAAQYLDARATPEQMQELAQQLLAVLNRGLVGNLDELSRSPEGNVKDGLRDNRDLVGYIQTTSGRLDILLDRVQRAGAPPIWLFSSETLRGVPRAFEELNVSGPAVFFQRLLPRSLSQVKVFSIQLWRWLFMILAVVVAMISASLLTRAFIPLLRSPICWMTGQADDRKLLLLRNPMRLLLLALAVRIFAGGAISVLARALWIGIAHVLTVAGVGWLLIQFSDLVADLRSRQLRRRQGTNQIAVLALAHRLFKILVLFFAIAWLLHSAGVNVSAMLAGLGIGGIALALAAQKTLEDLLGGITIVTRKAFRVGDFCQLADQRGTIEEVGLGSTRVRTLSNTVVTIPNAKVSQMSLENYSMRQKIWFHKTFGLRSDTSPEQMRRVLSQITQMLRGDQRVEKESARIRLIEFAASSLQVEIFVYVQTTDFIAFQEIQEDLLLHIMDIIAASGTSIAVPSQITYLDRGIRSQTGGQLFPDTAEQNRQAPSRETVERPQTGTAHSTGEP